MMTKNGMIKIENDPDAITALLFEEVPYRRLKETMQELTRRKNEERGFYRQSAFDAPVPRHIFKYGSSTS